MDHTGRLVYLIVDECWSGDLGLLSCTGHVWIINSVGNDAKASAAWQDASKIHSGSQGVTTFRARDGLSAIGHVIGTIHEHHYSWREFYVVGLPWNEMMRKVIADQIPGVSWSVAEEAIGFRICRA